MVRPGLSGAEGPSPECPPGVPFPALWLGQVPGLQSSERASPPSWGKVLKRERLNFLGFLEPSVNGLKIPVPYRMRAFTHTP